MASQSQDNDEPASPTPNLIAEASLIQQTGIPTSQAAEASTRRRPQNEAADAALGDRVDGATVLLSPACASFDQFRDFEARGDAFRALVADLVAARQAPRRAGGGAA